MLGYSSVLVEGDLVLTGIDKEVGVSSGEGVRWGMTRAIRGTIDDVGACWGGITAQCLVPCHRGEPYFVVKVYITGSPCRGVYPDGVEHCRRICRDRIVGVDIRLETMIDTALVMHGARRMACGIWYAEQEGCQGELTQLASDFCPIFVQKPHLDILYNVHLK